MNDGIRITGEKADVAVTGNVASLFQPDTLLADHFDYRRDKTLVEPEKQLMLAILEDALRCFQENCSAKHGKKKQLLENVQKWFFESSGGWVFGFESICSVFDLDPDYVRKGLMRWREKRLSKRRGAPLWKHRGNAASASRNHRTNGARLLQQ